MTGTDRFVRRNRVDERVAVGIGVAAGLAAALAGAEPTGGPVIDVVLVVAAVGLVVWAAASAPWWAPTGAAGLAAVMAANPIGAVVATVAFVVGLGIGVRRDDQSALRALVAAVALNVVIRSELGGFHGLSAVLGCTIGVVLFLVGLRRRPAAVRRSGRVAAFAVIGVGAAALLGLGVAAATARPDLTSGARLATEAVSALKAGDYERAADLFDASATAFARSEDDLGGVFAVPSQLIPVVAQNVRAGTDVSLAASVGLAEASAALRSIDVSTLSLVDGSVDLASIAAVEEPLVRVRDVLEQLRATRAGVSSPWLLGPLNRELSELDDRLDEAEPLVESALDAVRLTPGLLGAEQPRRYLVLFTTPVEARGVAGFVGNYAVVEVENGTFAVPEFGRRSDLEDYVRENGAVCDGCPVEMLARYGRFGLDSSSADGGFGDRGWTAVTLPAHFPYVGESAHVLFPQSGGEPIDGVIAIDPYVVQALMTYTGPVEVPELGITVQPAEADAFMLRDQYDLVADDLSGNDDRVDALETIASETIRRLLEGSLPPPFDIARDLGPLAAEQRVLFWSDDPDEQAFFDRVGVSGALPALGDDGGFAVVVSNAGHSKIDYFLERSVDVAVSTDPGGARQLVADVTLTNTAPASGLPDYVIGNSYGFERGTSYLWINFFGPSGLEQATRNGRPMELDQSREAGWQAYERYEAIPAGESVSFRLVFELGADRDGRNEPVRWEQPLAFRTSS